MDLFLLFHILLEQSCCKKYKKGQETGLRNRKHPKVLNDTKLVLNVNEWPPNHLGSIWYHSEPSDVPYSPNQFLAVDFFCHFLQQESSRPFA